MTCPTNKFVHNFIYNTGTSKCLIQCDSKVCDLTSGSINIPSITCACSFLHVITCACSFFNFLKCFLNPNRIDLVML